jgi:hypothetical protein
MKKKVLFLAIMFLSFYNCYSQLIPPIFTYHQSDKIKKQYTDSTSVSKSFFEYQTLTSKDKTLKALDENSYKNNYLKKIDLTYKNIEAKFEKVFFTVKNKQEAEVFFDQKGFSTLGLAQISGGLKRGTATVEYLSDIIGAGRVGFGATISKSEKSATDTIQKETIESFFATGGNAYLNYAYPFLVVGSAQSPGKIIGYFLPKISAILPVLGEETDKIVGNCDIATEIHANLLTMNEKFNFFGQLRTGYILGTKDMYQALYLNDEKPFFFGQWRLGVNINRIFSISVNGVLFGPVEIKDQLPVRIAVTLSPSI